MKTSDITEKLSKKIQWRRHPLNLYMKSGLEKKRVGDKIETIKGTGIIKEKRHSYESPDMLQGFIVEFDDKRIGKQFVSLDDCIVETLDDSPVKGINKSGKLDPCPFCGSKKVYLQTGKNDEGQSLFDAVICEYCGAQGPMYDGHPEDAVDGWNIKSTKQITNRLDKCLKK